MTDVLLLHAGVADRRMWAAQVEALEAAGHRIVAPDLPGFGDHALDPGTLDYVAWAAGEMHGRGTAVGCSFGGRIALELALARPELVASLVLIGAGITGWQWSDGAKAGYAAEEVAIERGDLAEAARQQAEMWLGPDATDDVRALTEAMTLRSYELQLPVEDRMTVTWPETPGTDRLAEVAVPTLVVVGADDLPDMVEMAAQLASGIPGARLETIAGAGHLPSLETPAELNRLLLDFLQ
jgi:3-oxoadipate enol-lactonase